MYPVETPEKQAPTSRSEEQSSAKPTRDSGSERPQDDQVYRDWASI